MAFDAFSAVQSLADGNRSFGDVVKDLSTAELADLREQVQIQLKDMPQNGDPARAERLQQLRTLLKGSVRSMIGTLAASLAFSKATGISLETTEQAPERIATPEKVVTREARTKSTASAFDKPVEHVAATPAAPVGAPEKPALSFADYKNIVDPKKEKNFFQNAMGFMTYRAARFIAKSSAKDSMLGKMFKKFGWDKSATAMTALMELGASAPSADIQKPTDSVLPVIQAPQTNVPPSVLPGPVQPVAPSPTVPAPEVVQPPITKPVLPQNPTPVAPVLPVQPSPIVPPTPSPTLPVEPPAPEKTSEIPAVITFDEFKAGTEILGTRIQVIGNTIMVGTKKWELVKKTNISPFGAPSFINVPVLFTGVEWKNDTLTISASLPDGPLKSIVEKSGFPTGDTERMPRTAALEMLDHLKTQSRETDIRRKVKDPKTGKEKEEVVSSLILSTK